jgi:hypothetical protein
MPEAMKKERHEPLNQKAHKDGQAKADLVVLDVPGIAVEEPRTMKDEYGTHAEYPFQSTS